MIHDKKVLAIIPARGGSKGIPRKNIKNLAGKPLIAWTIEEAKKSKYIDRLILTSEDKEIINVANEYGCEVPFVRPKELAQDDTPGVAPILHAIQEVPGFDYIVLLQPTSPLRLVKDIDGAIEKSEKNHGIACVSVCKTDKNPYWMYQLDSKDFMSPFINTDHFPVRRQDAPAIYQLNGAVYVSTVEELIKQRTFLQDKVLAYQMPSERSVDIDTIIDFKICEMLLKDREK
ncbi:acylneuraminate cytidylyltransferase family protein [Bacillus smithii]|uniref:acylneuraminate cytidylyltransferase family protein n=1 Tax=Bacillus smithii TaxID=1479 RepID=UPI0030C97B65